MSGVKEQRSSRSRSVAASAVLWAAAVVGGCSDTGDLRPPEIRLGEDVCGLCGMAVSDPRFAAAIVTRRDGRDEVMLLDDVGELAQCRLPKGDQHGVFVRDCRTERWLPAESAFYVKSERLRTPMGFGIGALETEAQAEAMREELDGVRVEYAQLRPTAPE